MPNRKELEFRLLHGYFWGPRRRRDKREKKNLKVITLNTFLFIVSQWCLDQGSVLKRDFISSRSVVLRDFTIYCLLSVYPKPMI